MKRWHKILGIIILSYLIFSTPVILMNSMLDMKYLVEMGNIDAFYNIVYWLSISLVISIIFSTILFISLCRKDKKK